MCQNPDELSSNARDVIENPKSNILLSPVSTWEIAIKSKTKSNNIILNVDLDSFITDAIKKYQINVIPMSINHSTGVKDLPFHHRCPFDRLLISVSNCEKAPIITCDSEIHKYDVKFIW
jgi:PIN domain nuclease of toxin-antitoxin system